MTFASRIDASMGVLVSMVSSLRRRLLLLLLGEGVPASAAVPGGRVPEEELHRSHLPPGVELEIVEVRQAGLVHEDPDPLALEGVILGLRRARVEVEDVAELRAASFAPLARHAEAQRRLLGKLLLLPDLLHNLAREGRQRDHRSSPCRAFNLWRLNRSPWSPARRSTRAPRAACATRGWRTSPGPGTRERPRRRRASRDPRGRSRSPASP